MPDDKLTLSLKLLAENSVYKRVLADTQTQTNRAVRALRADFASLKTFMGSVWGKLGAAGLGFGAFEIAKGAAVLDQHLTRIALSAGKSKVEVKDLREQLQGLSVKTGQNVNELAGGFERLFNLTNDWDITRKSIEAVNTAVTVTGASTDTLSKSLAVAQTLGKNLSTPGAASGIMNKLGVVAPGAGGLENVAGILNQIAPMAKLAGMNFEGAVTLIGEISQVTKNPEQMGEMAEQILKVFTNIRSLENKKGSLGQLMFGKSGERRDMLTVLSKVKTLYDTLSDKKKTDLLSQIAGGGDARSMKFAQMFLESNALTKGAGIQKDMASSAKKYEREMGDATADAAHQAARLKNLLTDAGEQFARPINKVLADAVKFGIDKVNLKDVGGVGLASGAAAVGIAGWYGTKLAKEFGGKFLGGKASLAGGVAEGAALSRVGVTSVYVVNFGEFGKALNSSPGSQFQEFLPEEAAAVPKGASGIKAVVTAAIAYGQSLGWAGLAGVALPVTAMAGVAYLANQESMKRRLAEKGAADAREKDQAFRDRFNLGSDDQTGIPKFDMPAPSVTVYVDNEKKKPTRTIVDKRGHF